MDMPEKPISDTIGKVAVEVYADVLRPPAKRVGTALETIFKVGLAPVGLLDWAFERSKEWLVGKVEQRLSTIPPEYRMSPALNIAVPALTNIASCVDEPTLREIYAELLLKALDSRSASSVHPAYIQIASQLSGQEALILASFRNKGVDPIFDEKSSSDWGTRDG